jgi:hypothetical protein
MPEPIPLNTAKRRNQRGSQPPQETEEITCPITALGHSDGKFWFLNVEGERRGLSARQLGARAEITALFLGDMAWLLQRFKAVDEEGKPIGWKINKATEFLMDACRRAGMYGDHVIIRKPGVWAGDNGYPIAHCGDALFVDGVKHPPGAKIAGQIFAAAAREPYPSSKPADVLVARSFQGDMETLWNFRDDGGSIMAIGLVGQAYLSGALSWRANGFLSGASNSGKSNLLNLMLAMTPLSHYTNDTSKAGIEGAVNGRALPTFIDESSDRSDGHGGQILMDVVLSASSGTGTKGHRGTADGGVRSIELVGSVIMASVTPPAMQPQHRSRFVMIELIKPESGADNTLAMAATIARAKKDGPAMFARVLAGFERYRPTLAVFRAALGRGGCVAREMDQLGAILAGHWLLTEDGVPQPNVADDTVKFIEAFVRGADEMARDDAPQLVLAQLLSKVVKLERSTDEETLARLISNTMLSDSEITMSELDQALYRREQAVKVLERWGIRPVRIDDVTDRQGRVIPRLSCGNGLWIDPRVQSLRGIFTGTPYEGDRWLFELMRLPSAKRSRTNVRIGAMPPGKSVWISWDDINDVSDTS